jgi:uncharacterized protein
MRILAMADIHGSNVVYQHIPRLAEEHRAELLVLAGDLLGARGDPPTIEDAQRASARQILIMLAPLAIPVLYIMGNDDWLELEPTSSQFLSIHGRRLDLGE